ncbi:hypothetical protein I5Q45_18595, partial [Serratia marcescens]|nr:hypothetical protein [Serratia marcescens]
LKGEWTETAANSGVYRATYTAKTAGTGLQATLTLNGASATPVTYAITAGVVAKAELSLDKASYVSGEAMNVTVTLKDAQGNAVLGQAAGLKDVKVPNAELKGAWTETAANAGIYRATYTAKTAGMGLQATLTLNGASATPVAYAITAGVVAKAELSLDKASYVSGETMTVTVTLKDAQGNAVLGQAAGLKDVKVPNAELKGAWTETAANSGVYRATYTAKTAGTGLQATLTLNGASTTPVTYAITVGVATVTHSTIVLDKASYVSGEAMTVTVTLKDAQGNPVSGQESGLDNAVAVPGGRIQTETHWSEEAVGTGKYRATYVARIAGNNQTATLKLSGEVRPSNKYAIAAGPAVPDTSTIDVDGERYMAGGDMKVTVMLKDAQGNPVSGEQDTLTPVVKVANAELKAAWTESSTGEYQASYTAVASGSGLTATLKRTGWSREVASKVYVIAVPTFEAVIVNDHQFPVSAGFPLTGFRGATFTLKLKDASASDFKWAANASWVNVNDGVVGFTGEGTGSSVTITATPKTGGNAITYSFNLKKWFTSKGNQTMTWGQANMTCSLPRINELTNNPSRYVDGRWTPVERSRAVGSLWNEWGDLEAYSGSGFYGYVHAWTSERVSDRSHYGVSLGTGHVFERNDRHEASNLTVNYTAVCRKNL